MHFYGNSYNRFAILSTDPDTKLKKKNKPKSKLNETVNSNQKINLNSNVKNIKTKTVQKSESLKNDQLKIENANIKTINGVKLKAKDPLLTKENTIKDRKNVNFIKKNNVTATKTPVLNSAKNIEDLKVFKNDDKKVKTVKKASKFDKMGYYKKMDINKTQKLKKSKEVLFNNDVRVHQYAMEAEEKIKNLKSDMKMIELNTVLKEQDAATKKSNANNINVNTEEDNRSMTYEEYILFKKMQKTLTGTKLSKKPLEIKLNASMETPPKVVRLIAEEMNNSQPQKSFAATLTEETLTNTKQDTTQTTASDTHTYTKSKLKQKQKTHLIEINCSKQFPALRSLK